MILPKIKEVENILNFAKKVFTKGSFRLVNNYISGLIIHTKKSIKKIAKALKVNQQTLNYTINESKYEQEKLEKRYIKKAKFMFRNADIYLLLDDTLVEKNGKHIEKTQKHFDHNSDNYIQGHQYFTAILRTPFLQLPIFPELYSKETDSKIEMAHNLVDKLNKNKIKLHTVLFDSWYSDKDLIKKCRGIGARVVCAIKTNRNIFIGKSNVGRKISFITDRIILQKMKNYSVEDKRYLVWERNARLNKIPSVKFIISQELKDKEVKGKAHLISTNIEDSPDEIIRSYKIRWGIETYHRDIKQNLGFADAFIRKGNGIVSHAIFVTIAYAVLSLFMFRNGMDMSIGECCEYLRNKSTKNLVHEIVVIDDRQNRLNQFEEVFV